MFIITINDAQNPVGVSPDMLLTLLSRPSLFIASPRRAITRLTTATVGPPDPDPPDLSTEMFLPPTTAFVSRSICGCI